MVVVQTEMFFFALDFRTTLKTLLRQYAAAHERAVDLDVAAFKGSPAVSRKYAMSAAGVFDSQRDGSPGDKRLF